jgi:hypothetical protein
MKKFKSELVLFIEQNERDQIKLIGRINDLYRHGMSEDRISEEDKLFISAVDYAHEQMLDFKNKNDLKLIHDKIKAKYQITIASHVNFIIEIADALHNTTKMQNKRYMRAMINKFLLDQIAKAEEQDDHKAVNSYLEKYIELNKLHESDNEEANPLSEKIFEFSSDPRLLKTFDADNDVKVLQAVKVLEETKKAQVFG